MLEDNREDISLKYSYISLLASKIDVIIFGGGRSGYVKAKSFSRKGYDVTVVSKEFCDELEKLADDIRLISDEYRLKYILDKHLIIVATDDEKTNEIIRDDCENHYKIYLDTTEPENGKFITPVEIKTNNMQVGIHTKIKSPKTSLFIGEKLKTAMEEYDDFTEYVGNLRNNILNRFEDRNMNLEVMNFVNSDDFYFFYSKGKHNLVLKLFWRDYFDF